MYNSKKAQSICEFAAIILIGIKIALFGMLSLGQDINSEESSEKCQNEKKIAASNEHNLLNVNQYKEINKILIKFLFSEDNIRSQSGDNLIVTQASEAGASKDYDKRFSGKAERLAVTAESNTLKAHSYNYSSENVYRKKIEQNTQKFNQIYFNGKTPTVKDVDNVLGIYKKHVSEYMSTENFSGEKMSSRISELKKDLNYHVSKKENNQALKEISRFSSDIYIAVKPEELPDKIDELLENAKAGKYESKFGIVADTRLQSGDNLIATQVSEAGASKDYNKRFYAISQFQQAIDIIREAFQRFLSFDSKNTDEK